MKTTVTAFIFHDDKLLLVFHKKLQRWMHVGGHLEESEFLDEALIREITEETGLQVKILGGYNYFSKELLEDSRIPQSQPFFIHGRLKDGENQYLCFDYVCVAKDNKIKLQKEELTDFKWIRENEIDSVDTTPFFKEFAKKAFAFYKERK